MSNDQDYVERILDAPPRLSVEAVEAARGPNTIGWWIAAAVAVGAVVGALYLLSGVRPSPAKLQAAHDRSVAEAQIDDAAFGAQIAAAHAAKAAQAATASQTQATEQAAQAGAASAEAAVHDASTTEPLPQP